MPAGSSWAFAWLGTRMKTFQRDVLAGLAQAPKSVPCKYLYDTRGARLFEDICKLEEYYPTRAELQILRRNIREIVSLLGPRCTVVELGSGSSIKSRLLLNHLETPCSFVPVDVARAQLLAASARLAGDYPGLEVRPVCADYTNNFALPENKANSRRRVLLFLGSTIGNFEPDEAVQFLRRLGAICGADGSLLIGVDLRKAPRVLHRAYNDSAGITAAFNLNVLARVRRELSADLNPSHFRHYAFYNEPAGRIEMHLISQRPETIRIADDEFPIARDEPILTEHSYKYSPEEFRELAAQADFEVTRCWMDKKQRFSLQHLVPQTAHSNELI
jgi:dimethylhistidine N-methyltransferase